MPRKPRTQATADIQESLDALFDVVEEKINGRKLLSEFIGQSGIVEVRGTNKRNKLSVEVSIISKKRIFTYEDYIEVGQHMWEFIDSCLETEDYLIDYSPHLNELIVKNKGITVYAMDM